MKKTLFLVIIIILLLAASCAKVEKPEACQEKWKCDPWSACLESRQTRMCRDLNYCETLTYKPTEVKACGGEELKMHDETAYADPQAKFMVQIMNKLISAFSGR